MERHRAPPGPGLDWTIVDWTGMDLDWTGLDLDMIGPGRGLVLDLTGPGLDWT